MVGSFQSFARFSVFLIHFPDGSTKPSSCASNSSLQEFLIRLHSFTHSGSLRKTHVKLVDRSFSAHIYWLAIEDANDEIEKSKDSVKPARSGIEQGLESKFEALLCSFEGWLDRKPMYILLLREQGDTRVKITQACNFQPQVESRASLHNVGFPVCTCRNMPGILVAILSLH